MRWNASSTGILPSMSNPIKPDQTRGMVVEQQRYRQYHGIVMIRHLARDVRRRVDLTDPDRLWRVDGLDRETAITLLKPDEFFRLAGPVRHRGAVRLAGTHRRFIDLNKGPAPDDGLY